MSYHDILTDNYDKPLHDILECCGVDLNHLVDKVPYYGSQPPERIKCDPLYLGFRTKLAKGDFTIFHGEKCRLVHSPFGSTVINTDDCYVIVVRKPNK